MVNILNQNIEKYKSSTKNQLTFKYEKKACNYGYKTMLLQNYSIKHKTV